MPDTFDPASWEPRFEAFVAPRSQSADPAHDLAHIKRVVANARRIAATEGGRMEIALPAAWLHDCVMVPKNSTRRAQASREAASTAIEFLNESGYPGKYLADIGHAIEAHSFSADVTPTTLEAKIVQDADRLDAIGAIGVARCLMLGGRFGNTLYHTEELVPKRRDPDDSQYVVDHFFAKLLGLAHTMKTEAAREEARRRTQFMRQFLDELAAEVSDETMRTSSIFDQASGG